MSISPHDALGLEGSPECFGSGASEITNIQLSSLGVIYLSDALYLPLGSIEVELGVNLSSL